MINLDEVIKLYEDRIEYDIMIIESAETMPHSSVDYRSLDEYREKLATHKQVAEWLRELKETKRLVAQLKAKLCDSSEYCAYCDELDMSERDHFTCKYKKKKIPAVCYWQVLTPAHFDDIPWTKNEA